MKSLLLSTLILITLTSCSVFNTDDDGFNEALKRWEQNKPDNYEFLYQKGCFCPGGLSPAIIQVKADTIYAVLNPETREPFKVYWSQSDSLENVLDVYPSFYNTIDDLFSVIDEARKGKADKLSTSYDDNLGYPLEIEIDYDKRAIDDEVGYTISGYKKN